MLKLLRGITHLDTLYIAYEGKEAEVKVILEIKRSGLDHSILLSLHTNRRHRCLRHLLAAIANYTII